MNAPGPHLPRDVEVELVERVFAQHADRTTTLAAAGTRVPASRYVSADQLARETATLFRARPVFACMSVDVPSPGDRVAFESGGVPVVVVRARDGAVRAYANVCRHRGAPLVRGLGPGEHGSNQDSFVCPFHGWVYDTADGNLIAQPRSCDGFDGVDPCELGLIALPVAERHGIVVVQPGGAGTAGGPDLDVDVDDWLSGLGPDLAGLAFDTLVPYDRASTAWDCNWKLLIDTFLESYHVPTLHKATLAASYIGAASPFDAFGPHNRIVVPQAAILQQAALPRDQWDLLAASVLQYFLAPNLVISNLYGYVMTWRFVPDGPGRTSVEQVLYTYRPATSAEDRAHFDQRFEAARAVTSNEDFPESERVHRGLRSGMIEATVVGRNEPGIVHFHETIAAATSLD